MGTKQSKQSKLMTTMKRTDLFLVVACNEVSAEAEVAACNEALSAANFRVLDGGALAVPFGDFPQVVILQGAAAEAARKMGVKVGPGGKTVVIQRVDAEAGNAMAAELSGLLGMARRFFMGAPIYNGHPTHPDPEARKAYGDKRAYGWIKGITVEEDHLRFDGKYNRLGSEAVNDAQLAYHSPEWSMALIGAENGVGIYRPVKLRSTGLTNEPNIPVPSLVASNAKNQEEETDEDQVNVPGEDFMGAARAALARAEAADFEPLAIALNAALAGNEEGLMGRLEELRERLPELAQEVAANEETVQAWEAVLGAAMGNGMAAAVEETLETEAETQTEEQEDTDMLKKLIELLAAAGLIQATDNEEAVLMKLGSLKQEMDWKREEMARQKAEAERIRAMLPAANVAGLEDAGEDVPLLSADLVTATANTITQLQESVTAANAERDAFREGLVNATLERLLAANEITGAEVPKVTEVLMGCANTAALAEAVQELCKGAASGGERLSKECGDGKGKVIAANDSASQTAQRVELVEKHKRAICGEKKPNQAQHDLAWSKARQERPDLF